MRYNPVIIIIILFLSSYINCLEHVVYNKTAYKAYNKKNKYFFKEKSNIFYGENKFYSTSSGIDRAWFILNKSNKISKFAKNNLVEVDVITEDFSWENLGVISTFGLGSNRESTKTSLSSGFLWGGHNASTTGGEIEAVTGGLQFSGIEDNSSNIKGSYVYTIFSSNSNSVPNQSIDLSDVGATIKIYFLEADPNQSFRFMIRDSNGEWYLSQTNYSLGWWSENQGFGTPKVLEENYTNVHKAFPVNTFLWNKLESTIRANLNLLNTGDNISITSSETYSNPDLTSITGAGIYIEEPFSNAQAPLRIEKFELHKKEALIVYNPAYSSHYITSKNKGVKWGVSNLGGGGSGEFYYPEAHPTQNLNASGWGRAFQSAWRSFYHDGGYNPTQGGRTRIHGAPTDMSYSTSSTGGTNTSRIDYGPFRVPTMGRPGTAEEPFDILTHWDLTNGKIPGGVDTTEGIDDDNIDESNGSEEDEVITEYRMSGFYEDISNIIEDSGAEGIRIYNQYDYYDDPYMIYQYQTQLKSNFTNGIRDMVSYTEEAELPNAVRPTRIGIFWGDRLWSEKFNKAWVLNSSDENWSTYDVNSPTDPGGDWGTTHERLTVISGPGGADDAYAVGMYFPEWSNYNQKCIAGIEQESGNVIYEEDRLVPDSFEYRFGIRGEGIDIYEQGSANIIKAFVKRDLGFQVVGMVEPRILDGKRVFERLRLELFHLVGTPNQIKDAVKALDNYFIGLANDNTAPVISLTGDANVTIEVGTSYTDAGATAQDNYDGDITDDIVTVNNVDTSTIGTYTVTYNVSDASGNDAVQVTRTVNVVDTTIPVISLTGDANVTIEVGTSYTDAGATAQDNYDGDITDDIVTVNNVDTSTIGTYTVTYDVSDANNNDAVQVIRTVNIESNLSVDENIKSIFKVYPNPTKNSWMINASIIIESIELYDIVGRKVLSVKPKSQDYDINGTLLSDGVYILLINGKKVSRLVKN